MKTLGIRVEPKRIWFSIYCTDSSTVINVDKIIVPEILDTPEKLKVIRNNIIDIIREYDIKLAGIRMFEGNSKTISIERLFIEGVIQESFASSNLEDYTIFRLSSLAARFRVSSKALKDNIENGSELHGIKLKELTSKPERESLLASIGVSL
ncbi:hypothetical protein [Serratia liquefaciens]|uniref:hypothetical protein n=1 Tax=Serratia liquefaciens TaxID=614 RepID=UPI0021C78C9C|nr:hypothetical protein [Serratia liquefaciens]